MPDEGGVVKQRLLRIVAGAFVALALLALGWIVARFGGLVS